MQMKREAIRTTSDSALVDSVYERFSPEQASGIVNAELPNTPQRALTKDAQEPEK
jgi:hypothetical protein